MTCKICNVQLDVLKQDLTRVRLTLERDCVALQDKDTETQTVNNNNNNADTTASDSASAAGHEERCVSASDDADPIARSPSSPPAHKNIKRRSTVPKGYFTHDLYLSLSLYQLLFS